MVVATAKTSEITVSFRTSSATAATDTAAAAEAEEEERDVILGLSGVGVEPAYRSQGYGGAVRRACTYTTHVDDDDDDAHTAHLVWRTRCAGQ